jgi:DNA-binding CsgD family transcriptional regulator
MNLTRGSAPEDDAILTPSARSNGSERLRLAHGLSPREVEVAMLVAQGLQNKEIAAILGTAPDTVRHQTVRIYAKTGVTTRTALAVLVMRCQGARTW